MTAPGETRFSVSVGAGLWGSGLLESGSVTGRVFVVVTRSVDRPYVVASGPGEIGGTEHGVEPRLQAGAWKHRVPFFGTYQESVPYFSPWVGSVPFFGVDVEGLAAGEVAVIDGDTLGFPPRSLADIPAGEYYVQAVLNVYTEFHRADGHVVWAHMDQWEGQHWNMSAGNPVSAVHKVILDPEVGYDIYLELGETIPEPKIPEDTEFVRRIKFVSPLLSEFWGHPMYLGATALLPRGYDGNPDERYPVIYSKGHFSLGAPFGFSTVDAPEGDEQSYMRSLRGLESGYELYQSWTSDGFPKVMVITFQHPTPFYDTSYAANSVNHGPYGDAIMTELIPAVEAEWRTVAEPFARALTGGSSGGWTSLALQLYHPEFFGGAWAFAPGSVDLRRYRAINLYSDENAFTAPNREWLIPERIFYRSPDGQPEITIRQISQLEAVLGSKGRSSELLDAKQETAGPIGDDGYPKDLWDKATGVIDHEVANYMRDNGYDLRHYIEQNWDTIGPDLVGKLHIYCADMDDYFLNLGVYPLEDFLENTTNPYYGGSFTYGRPMDGHVWHPMNHADLIRIIADHIEKHAKPPHHHSSIPTRVHHQISNQ